MIKVALTGSIGMGKSTVAAMFERAGVPVFDADAVVRSLQGPGGALLERINARFPGTVRNGTLDREQLAGIAPQPQTLPAKLEGRSASDALFNEAAQACSGLEAMHDVNFDAEYRRRLAKAMVMRALRKAHGRIAKR